MQQMQITKSKLGISKLQLMQKHIFLCTALRFCAIFYQNLAHNASIAFMLALPTIFAKFYTTFLLAYTAFTKTMFWQIVLWQIVLTLHFTHALNRG